MASPSAHLFFFIPIHVLTTFVQNHVLRKKEIRESDWAGQTPHCPKKQLLFKGIHWKSLLLAHNPWPLGSQERCITQPQIHLKFTPGTKDCCFHLRPVTPDKVTRTRTANEQNNVYCSSGFLTFCWMPLIPGHLQMQRDTAVRGL